MIFPRLVDLMVDTVLPDWPVLTPATRMEVLGNCTTFVHRQLKFAPLYVRLGTRVLLMAFRIYAILRLGPWPLAWAKREERVKVLAEFSSLPFPIVAGLERLLRSMTILTFLEEPLVLAALGEPTAAERQTTFRAKRQEMMNRK